MGLKPLGRKGKEEMMQPKSSTKYVLEPKKNADIEGWLTQARAGTYKTFVKSQMKSDIQAEQEETAVQILIGKTFEKSVYDTNSDTFVEFYAPWCGHCKKYA